MEVVTLNYIKLFVWKINVPVDVWLQNIILQTCLYHTWHICTHCTVKSILTCTHSRWMSYFSWLTGTGRYQDTNHVKGRSATSILSSCQPNFTYCIPNLYELVRMAGHGRRLDGSSVADDQKKIGQRLITIHKGTSWLCDNTCTHTHTAV